MNRTQQDHGTHTVADAAWHEHRRAMDEYVDERPSLSELGDDK